MHVHLLALTELFRRITIVTGERRATRWTRSRWNSPGHARLSSECNNCYLPERQNTANGNPVTSEAGAGRDRLVYHRTVTAVRDSRLNFQFYPGRTDNISRVLSRGDRWNIVISFIILSWTRTLGNIDTVFRLTAGGGRYLRWYFVGHYDRKTRPGRRSRGAA